MRNTKTDLAKLFKAFKDGTPLVYREVSRVEKRTILSRFIVNRIELRDDNSIDLIQGRIVDGKLVVFSDSVQMLPYWPGEIIPLDGILFSTDDCISKQTLIKD